MIARRFTIFVFVSMPAYSTQDLILEPFAGLVFDLTPGQPTQLTGVQHGGVLLGVGVLGTSGVDAIEAITVSKAWAYGLVFAAQAVLILVAARLMLSIERISNESDQRALADPTPATEN